MPPSQIELASELWVSRGDLHKWQWSERALPDLATGQIALKIERFAFTANNITYARLGEPPAQTTLSYWRFFPADPGWGVIPVWGIAEVVGSRHDGIRLGERIYGFYPLASHAVLEPRIKSNGYVVDATPHRGELPAIYQDYVLVDRAPRYDHMRKDEYLVLRPAFSLSFCCAAFLRDEDWFRAKRIVISSASSKAALGLGFLLSRSRPRESQIFGLTAAARVDLLSRTGSFDRVYSYDDVGDLPSDAPTVFVDIAGDAGLVAAVHHRLSENLVYSVRAGFTHGDAVSDPAATLPGPAPIMFSTPAHMLSRRSQWGIETYWKRFTEAYEAFLAHVSPWLAIQHASGKAEVARTYCQILAGRMTPDTSYVMSVGE